MGAEWQERPVARTDAIGGRAAPVSIDVEATDDELTLRAADGSKAAAGELLARHLPRLTSAARRLAVPSIDPDDLVAEAMANLLSQWSQGKGPREHVVAYVIRSMRNRATDELRSPRSRNVALEPDTEPAVESSGFHVVEIHREIDVVRTAISQLPEDQRLVLTATVVDGRKPGDLAEELGRRPAAVYALLYRARHALQRSVLTVLVEQEGGTACSREVRHLPSIVTPGLVDEGGSRAARHMAGCATCGRAWQRYLALVAGCGIASLVVVVGTGFASAPPAAAVELPHDALRPAASSPSRATAARAVRRVGSHLAWRVVAGSVSVVAGLSLASSGVIASVPRVSSSAGATPLTTFSVQLVSPTQQQTAVTVRIAVDHPWTVESLTFTLPQRTALDSAPARWFCHYTESNVVECLTGQSSAAGGTFTFTTALEGEPAHLSVLMKASAGSVPITATSESDFPY